MKILTALISLALLASVMQFASAAPPSGLIESSRQMIAYLQEVESKLVADQATLNDGFGDLIDGAQTAVSLAADFRKQMELQRILLGLHSVWDDQRFRKPVLYSIAQVNLAVDEIAASQMIDVRSLENSRKSGMSTLIGLVRALRKNQQELVDYLADESASKRLGELNIGLIATSVAEAKELRNALDGKADATVDVDEEKKNLQNAVDNLQRLLELIDR